MKHAHSLIVGTSLLLACAAVGAQPVTLRLQAEPEPNATSDAPAVAADGRSVVFRSLASNLAPGGGTLYAWNRDTRTLTALAPTANGNIFAPAVSSDGRYVAFETNANNLAPGLDSSFGDVLRLDRQTGQFQRASQGFGGTAANSVSQTAGISGDGRTVVFASLASNLVSPGTTPNRRHIYAMDMDTGVVELVTRSTSGAEGGRDAELLEAMSVSSDGRRIVFATGAENLAPVFAGNVADVLVRTRDPQTGAVSFENVNRSASGEVGTLGSSRGSISPNGRWVVFRSSATNVLPGGAPSGLYLRDLDNNVLSAVPLPAGFQTCNRARVADTGDVVMQCAPQSQTTALQIFVARRATGETILQSTAVQGGPGNGTAGPTFSISGDGRLVAFESSASDHLVTDANVAADVFIRTDAAVLDTLLADGFE